MAAAMEAIEIFAAESRANERPVWGDKCRYLTQRVIVNDVAALRPNICLNAVDFARKAGFMSKDEHFAHEGRSTRIAKFHACSFEMPDLVYRFWHHLFNLFFQRERIW